MQFSTNNTYQVFSAKHPHLVVTTSNKGEGCLELATPATNNPQTGEVISFEDKLVYLGRIELDGVKGKHPAFKTLKGTIVRGHSNHFDPNTRYSKEIVANRSDVNAANVKPEGIADSIKVLVSGLLARDPKMTLGLLQELEKVANERVADLVVDEVLEQELLVIDEVEVTTGDVGNLDIEELQNVG